MGELALLAKIREWISGVAFGVFLWSIQMTQDEYFDTIIGDHGLVELEQENTDLHNLVWDLRSENYANISELSQLRQENIELKARLDTNRAQVKAMATEKRKPVCSSCAGEGQVIGEDGTVWVCGICGGTGKRG